MRHPAKALCQTLVVCAQEPCLCTLVAVTSKRSELALCLLKLLQHFVYNTCTAVDTVVNSHKQLNHGIMLVDTCSFCMFCVPSPPTLVCWRM